MRSVTNEEQGRGWEVALEVGVHGTFFTAMPISWCCGSYSRIPLPKEAAPLCIFRNLALSSPFNFTEGREVYVELTEFHSHDFKAKYRFVYKRPGILELKVFLCCFFFS